MPVNASAVWRSESGVEFGEPLAHRERVWRRLRPNVPTRKCLTELGSGQRQFSVGGAITHFRCRSLRRRPSAPARLPAPLRSIHRHPQSGSRMRHCRWFQADEHVDAGRFDRSGRHRRGCRRRSLRPQRSAPTSVHVRPGKRFRPGELERHQMAWNSFLA